MLPEVLAAVVRAMSAVRSLAAFEHGAVGPSKDCAVSMRFVAAGVDGGYFGDDYGAQRAMLFSPRLWRRRIKPRLVKLFAVFVDAGLPVILHSDGDIRTVLPDLVEIGLTTLNPVQPEVLDHAWLQRNYGSKLSFYGGVSTQGVLPDGTVEEVRAATVACARSLAPERTGLPPVLRTGCNPTFHPATWR